MTRRAHRPQKAGALHDDAKPLVVRPLEQLDRLHNPKDLDIDEAAIRNGVEHGGMTESRAEALAARGNGGRKRTRGYGRGR